MTYQKYLSGHVLLIVAVIAFKLAVIPLGAVSILMLIINLKPSGILTYLNNVAYGLAVAVDVMGNVLFGYALTKLFCKDTIMNNKYKFGQVETISRALGKNKSQDTLTDTGRAVANFLNWIDKDHVEKAAK